MILKKFTAENVFGYLNFDIDFNSDVSFLVGGNGTGKTTALKLMNALITPNFKDLIQIPFHSLSLEVEDDGNLITISASSSEKNIHLKISTSNEVLTLPSYSNEEFEFYAHRQDKVDGLLEEINRRYADNPIVVKIAEIQSPIFLGLDRRMDEASHDDSDYYSERDTFLRAKNKRVARARRLIKGSIGVSLMETEMLVQNSYKKTRVVEETYSSKLRDSILLSAFQYSKFKPEDSVSNMLLWQEKSSLLEREKEIKIAISKIGINDSRLSDEVDNYFIEIKKLFEQLKQAKEGLTVEWLLNKAQIERMTTIVEIIDDHKSKVDKLFKPINDFLTTVNEFFVNSNKVIEIDAVGQLNVIRPDGNKCTIEGLSSGERQLLVIFSHAFFNRYAEKNTVFIIDEPELSLHLSWQEKIAEAIFSISPNSQYILATHSPEIVGENKNKCVMCR